MSVWYCIPSVRPPEEAEKVLKLWRERGYKIALWTDEHPRMADWWSTERADYQHSQTKYPGYAIAVNTLIRELMESRADAEWFVTGGDDTEPDPNHSAEEISESCKDYFSDLHHSRCEQSTPGSAMSRMLTGEEFETFGVMQPTGDRWLVNGPGTQPGIDLVAGSPWMGREFCRRINQGKGPLWPEYFHCGEDEELQEVATRLGIFWQRPDLTHFHNHWGRPRDGERIGQADRMPEFLKRANSPEEWAKFKKLFAERKAAGFPGSDPIA